MIYVSKTSSKEINTNTNNNNNQDDAQTLLRKAGEQQARDIAEDMQKSIAKFMGKYQFEIPDTFGKKTKWNKKGLSKIDERNIEAAQENTAESLKKYQQVQKEYDKLQKELDKIKDTESEEYTAKEKELEAKGEEFKKYKKAYQDAAYNTSKTILKAYLRADDLITPPSDDLIDAWDEGTIYTLTMALHIKKQNDIPEHRSLFLD